VLDSFTINLSFGLLPVLFPVVAEKAPLLAITPSLLLIAALINSSVVSSRAWDVFDWVFIFSYQIL
jgi:hypothetical protein